MALRLKKEDKYLSLYNAWNTLNTLVCLNFLGYEKMIFSCIRKNVMVLPSFESWEHNLANGFPVKTMPIVTLLSLLRFYPHLYMPINNQWKNQWKNQWLKFLANTKNKHKKMSSNFTEVRPSNFMQNFRKILSRVWDDCGSFIGPSPSEGGGPQSDISAHLIQFEMVPLESGDLTFSKWSYIFREFFLKLFYLIFKYLLLTLTPQGLISTNKWVLIPKILSHSRYATHFPSHVPTLQVSRIWNNIVSLYPLYHI